MTDGRNASSRGCMFLLSLIRETVCNIRLITSTWAAPFVVCNRYYHDITNSFPGVYGFLKIGSWSVSHGWEDNQHDIYHYSFHITGKCRIYDEHHMRRCANPRYQYLGLRLFRFGYSTPMGFQYNREFNCFSGNDGLTCLNIDW